MSNIKALEDLREWIDGRDGMGLAPLMVRRAHKIADDIEAEIAERFTELPVDADGVPIRTGDTVEDINSGYRFMVIKAGFYKGRWGINGHWPDKLRHVKPDTVESLIDDLLEEANCKVNEDGSCVRGVSYARRAEYAERIRKAVEQ